MAYGWYGKRSELIGTINPRDGVSGIRVKVGNITIGGERLLDDCFRESRFNGYVIGEIHVVSPLLIPNSRRDDFVDNKEKTLFYNAVEREVGLPISREIRLRSRLNSQRLQLKTINNSKAIFNDKKLTRKISDKLKEKPGENTADSVEEIFSECLDCEKVRLIKEKLGL